MGTDNDAPQPARTSADYEDLLDRRDWEVHFLRWDFRELHSQSEGSLTALRNWLPEEVLDHVLPTKATVREFLDEAVAEANRIHGQIEARAWAAFEQKLTAEQYRRKFDPLTGVWTAGDPSEDPGTA